LRVASANTVPHGKGGVHARVALQVALIALGVLFEWLSREHLGPDTLGFAVERAPIALRFSTGWVISTASLRLLRPRAR
jgi:hypothetical protein